MSSTDDIFAATAMIHPKFAAELREATTALTRDIGASLGESPEAWRGAALLARELLGGIRYMCSKADEAGMPTEAAYGITLGVATAAMRVFLDNPLAKDALRG